MDVIDTQLWSYPSLPDNSTAVPFNESVVVSWQDALSQNVEERISDVNTTNMDLILVNSPTRQIAYVLGCKSAFTLRKSSVPTNILLTHPFKPAST